jgi:hypothetical protein
LASIKIEHLVDEDPHLEDLGVYSDLPGPDDRTVDRPGHRYFIAAMSGEETGNPDSVEQDYQRMEAYNNGEWYMAGIRAVAEVTCPVGNGNSRIERLSSGGLWGIESDSDMGDIEQEQLDDLREHLEHFGVDVNNFAELAAKAVVVME